MTSKAEKYLHMAYRRAQAFSDDPHTQTGAVLLMKNGVLSFGENRLANSCWHDDATKLARPMKYKYIEHAERLSIFRAASEGHKTYGSTMYAPWAACCDCARAIILAGVTRVVVHQEMMDLTPDRWKPEIEIAMEMFAASGVQIDRWSGKIGGIEIKVDGEIWKP